MVAIASTAVQASEMERKRKQTLERTRANHLSRQLQMRLQYARLKVDYGWQRQNLNEVENLYFHHSHRGTKMHHRRPSLVVTPSDDNSASFSSSGQLDVSYKTSMSRSATLDPFLDAFVQRSGMGAECFPASTPPPPQTGVGSHDPSATASSTAPEFQTSQLRECSSLIPSSMYNERSAPETGLPSDSPSQPIAVTGSTTTIMNPTPLRSHHFTTATTGNPSFIRTLSPIAAVSANQVKMPLLMHKDVSSLAKHDKFGSNKSTTLTYDSFWSGIQSKSYPAALKNGGSGLNTGTVNNQLSNNVPNMTTSTTTALGTISTQSLTPNVTSPASPLPLMPSHQHHPPAQSSITSSHTPTSSLPSASTHTPTFSSQITSFTPPPQTTQTIQLQMQQNRLFIDSLAAWNLIASQQYPGSINAQQNIITGSLVGPTTTYPFLANVSASYAQAFNAGVDVQGPHSQGNELGAFDNNTTSPMAVVPPPSNNTSSVSSPVPTPQPVASTSVGQEGS